MSLVSNAIGRPGLLIALLSRMPSAQTAPPMRATPSGTPLAAYRAFFQHVQYLETAANTAGSSEAAQLRNYHQRNLGLNNQEASAIKNIAAAHAAVVGDLDKQAAAIIVATRAKFPGGRLPSKSGLPQVPAQLGDLQKQRDEATLVHVRALRSQLLPGSAQKIDSYVKVRFANKAQMPSVGPHPGAPQSVPATTRQ
jgi:hypothetical protein